MKPSADVERRGCLSDEVIEELGVELSSHPAVPTEPAVPEAEAHLRDCPECGLRLDRAIREAALIRQLLVQTPESGEGGCLSEEDLALYFDRALDVPARQNTERHLAQCLRCQRILAKMYREVQAVLNATEADENDASVEQVAFDKIKADAAARSEGREENAVQESGTGEASTTSAPDVQRRGIR